MIRLTDILKENKEKRDAGMVSGVADIVSKVKDKENRKDIANQMLNKFDLEDVDYDKDSFLKLSGVTEASKSDTIKNLELQKLKLINKTLKMMPKSPAQLKVRAEIDKIGKQIDKLKVSKEIAEVSDNDTNLVTILRHFDSGSPFTKKKIGAAVTRNPNATRKDIYNALRDMGHEDTVDARKDLRMWEGNLCEDCWKGYKAVGVKKKGDKMVPNCVPQNEDTAPLPMLQKPAKPKKAKISKPRFGGTKPAQTDQDRIKRATVRLDVSKKNLSVAGTPRQKTQIQRRIQKQQQRLTKLKQNITAKKKP